MELAILVGLQASGKTTFYRQHLAVTHALVSKDLLSARSGKEHQQAAAVEELLAAGTSVAVDNTNPSRAQRAPLIRLGRRHGARIVGYELKSDLLDCMDRNARRQGRERVPDVGVVTTAQLLERPAYEEGFGVLWLVRIDGAGGFRVAPAPRLRTTFSTQ